MKKLLMACLAFVLFAPCLYPQNNKNFAGILLQCINDSDNINAADYSPITFNIMPATCKAWAAAYGRAKSAAVTDNKSNPKKVEVVFNKVKFAVSVYEDKNGRISGLQSDNFPIKDDIIKKVGQLSGEVSFLIKDLKNDAILMALNEKESMPLASGVKVFVLDALAKNKANWKKVLFVKPEYKTFGSKYLNAWPDNAPITVHTAVLLMIASNDNTAGDLVIDFLGSVKMRKHMAGIGIERYKSGYPFLTANQIIMFQLYPDMAQAFIVATDKNKHKVLEALDGLSAKTDKDALNFEQLKPRWQKYYKAIEWYASAQDVCGALERLAENKDARDILAYNTEFSGIPDNLSYSGLVESSRPGIYTSSWLGETKEGNRYCVSLLHNSEKDIQMNDIISLMRHYVSMLK